LSDQAWAELVDLIDPDGNAADENRVGQLLHLTMPGQQVEAIAARSNVARIVAMLHDSSSQMMGLLTATC
jgi:hypothetical protein